MNVFRYITVLAATTVLATSAMAQTDARSSSSSVVRKGSRNDRTEVSKGGSYVTVLMLKFFEEPYGSDSE